MIKPRFFGRIRRPLVQEARAWAPPVATVPAAILLVAALVQAEPPKAPVSAAPAVTAPATVGKPDIEFDSLAKDLGVVDEGRKLEFTFEIRNVGDADLKIQSVKGSCGCTKVRAEKMQLAPGEVTRLLGVFDTKGRSGKQSKTVNVVTNDPDEQRTVVRFSCRIFSEIEFLPKQIHFARATGESLTTKTLQIVGRTSPTLEITSLRVTGTEHVEASILDRRISTEPALDGRESQEVVTYDVLVSLLPGAPIGHLRGSLEAETNVKKHAKIIKLINGNVTGDIRISPSVLSYGKMGPGRTATQTLVLTAQSNTAFKVLGVDTGDLNLDWRTESDAAMRIQRVTFQFTAPDDATHRINKRIKIKTDHPRQPLIDCTVVAVIDKKQTATAKPGG